MKSEQLIQSLIGQTKKIINKASSLKDENPANLKWRPEPNSWNILECLEHLNLYGKFYLHEIEKSILNAKKQSTPDFKSGFLGNYFANSMLPKEQLNKMKTFKNKNPLNSNLNKQQVLNEFTNQQQQLLNLLNQSQDVDLNNTKVRTTLSNFIKLKLGDIFQFLINHNLRHLKQIERIEQQLKNI
ncbi:DinB family protein [Pseudopedobacter beijingensis]|uniref:DinB family protein n=1 Tax=Pseudopedobacter beijingensis TaxID=1207056 RepID=A0ABW4IFH4_9SPHI